MQPSFAAWPIIVLPFVAAKAKVCFGKAFTPAAFLETCQRERITKAPLVPTMWRMVFEAGPENYDLSALTLVSISGEAPAPSDVRQLYDRICKNICCVYLSGEAFTASGVMANTRDLMERGKIGSSGRPVVGGDVRILVPGGGFDDEAPQRRDRRDRDIRAVACDRILEGPGTDARKIPRRLVAQRRSRAARCRQLSLGLRPHRQRHQHRRHQGQRRGDRARAAVASRVAQCAVVGQPDAQLGQRIEAYLVARGAPPDA